MFQFKQMMMLVDPNDDEDDKAASPPPQDDFNDPNNPGYCDPNVELQSFKAQEADEIAATMQPTVINTWKCQQFIKGVMTWAKVTSLVCRF